MPLDLGLEPRTEEWQARIAEFVRSEVIMREQDIFRRGLDDQTRMELQNAAKKAGVWAPTAPASMGGGGFPLDQAAALLEEAGASLLGPLALNCAAPDEGNIHLLDQVAVGDQREKYLRPLVEGTIRSCFAMTEPSPGAGSDPSALRTTARRTTRGWTITGQKHFISGAQGAAFTIVMTRDGDGDGSTMFLVDMDSPGVYIGEPMQLIDTTTVGGHCPVTFDGVTVGNDAVLGEPGQGFRYAQVRLAPARLTHCMRWLGAARRAHSISLNRALGRELFGQRLADQGMAQQMIADNEIEIAACRAMLWHAAWELSSGLKSNEGSSRAKVFISEAVGRIVDRSTQLAGGLGTSSDFVIGRIYADIRAFRIYDGASEVHRMSIARRTVRRVESQGFAAIPSD